MSTTLATLSLSALALLSSAPDELPLDAWIEAAETLGPLQLRYRVVNREGEVNFLEVLLRGTDEFYFRFRREGASESREIWITGAAMTHVSVEGNGEIETFSLDLSTGLQGPAEWLASSAEALGIDEIAIPDARVLFSLWPSEEDDLTWHFDATAALSRASTFGWLERLRGEPYRAERRGDVFAVTLECGAEFLLDADTGVIRQIVIDPSDEDAGLIVAEVFEPDAQLDADAFEPVVPDDAVDVAPAGLQGQWDQTAWRYVRIEWTSTLEKEAEASEGFLARHADGIRDCAVEFYLTSFAEPIAASVAEMRESLDAEADRMLGIWERTRDQPGAREAFDAAHEQLEKAVADGCQKRAKVHADEVVVAPYESDSASMELLLDMERQAATDAFERAFFDPAKAHLDERFAKVDDTPLRAGIALR